MRKIGILGASFNPIHIAHLIIAEQARIRLDLDKILFIPTFNPYHKNVNLMDYDDRVKMVKDIIKDNKYFSLSEIEKNIEGNSYSLNIINALIEEEKADYYFIIGSDNLLSIDTWYKYEDLIKTVNLIIFERPGYPYDKDLVEKYQSITDKKIYYFDDLQMQISSSMIRESIRNDVYPRYILADKSIKFLKEHNPWK